jgi:hypothetical protein
MWFTLWPRRRRTLAKRQPARYRPRLEALEDRFLPSALTAFSTYLGGGSADVATAVAVDSSGNTYITGYTSSTNFPTTKGAYQTHNNGGYDAFVTKLNPSGGVAWSTYLGGKGDDYGLGIAVDGSGNVYVTGATSSTNFPTKSPLQAANGGGYDAFVTELNATGSGLVYSTYLGGSGNEDFSSFGTGPQSDFAGAIAVDASGNAYVTGLTSSTNFPTANAFQGSYQGNAGGSDAFVAKINAGGTGLAYATYLGTSGHEAGLGIAVDASGDAYVTGTAGTSFPTTTGAFQTTDPTGGAPVAFVTELNPSGTGLVYSTYLGGSTHGTQALGIAINASGDAYVTGETTATDFPVTPGAFQTTPALNVPNAFVTVLNATGSGLVYSSYLGGNGANGVSGTVNVGTGIAVDSAGNAYLTGWTSATNFPTANAFQPAYGGGNADAFVAQLHPFQSGTASLVYSSYLGGSDRDEANGIAVDGAGNAYVVGETFSTSFPTKNAFQSRLGGSKGYSDALVTKIEPLA